MMKLLTLAFAAMLGATAIAQNGPMIQVDKEVHDYGTIAQGANGECSFVVTNTGDAPLIITNCKGSCGCTVPKCDTTPIPPGQKSTVSVRYDTKRTGPINKSVTITSNAVNEPDKIVRVKGMVSGGAEDGATPH
ncbi:MAG: DUF1573 domain-containing protein [Flavobacteriales bacterium]|nr:DUF1573 domain-containing protein [Flavobacteriales bacterium]